MSVFTPVNRDELQLFLQRYGLGALVEHEGISAGIENTNYFVTTERGRYVLTLFEKHSAEDMPYFLGLMAHLADRGVPCPHPIADQSGNYLQRLKDKPAALVQRLRGEAPVAPTLGQCRAIGAALGRMHLATQDFADSRANDRGPQWWRATADKLIPRLGPHEAELLREELRFQGLYRFTDLPRGVIHADLFRDNAMFEGDELTGIIDFYYACNDALLYDLAVTANDWCSYDDGRLDQDRLRALMVAYDEQRPLQAIERGAWPVMMRAAALRFWLSRLYDLHFPREGELVHTKDPHAFKEILLDRIDNEVASQLNWV